MDDMALRVKLIEEIARLAMLSGAKELLEAAEESFRLLEDRKARLVSIEEEILASEKKKMLLREEVAALTQETEQRRVDLLQQHAEFHAGITKRMEEAERNVREVEEKAAATVAVIEETLREKRDDLLAVESRLVAAEEKLRELKGL